MTKAELQLVQAVSNENSRLRAALQLIAQEAAPYRRDWDVACLAQPILEIIATTFTAGTA